MRGNRDAWAFDAAWPELRHRLLMERVSGDEERRMREAFDGFKL